MGNAWQRRTILAVAALALAGAAPRKVPPAKPAPAPAFAGPVIALAGGGGTAMDLAAGLPVSLVMTTPLGGDSAVGDPVALALADDIVSDGIIVVPAGAPASGRVTLRSGSGKRGDPVLIEFEITELKIGATPVATGGRHHLTLIDDRHGGGVDSWAIAGDGPPGAAPPDSVRHFGDAAGTAFGARIEPPLRFVLPVFAPRSLPDATAPLAVREALRTVRAVVASGTVPVRRADTPSGYCYDVPRNYRGIGSVRAPAPNRLAPPCWQIGGAG